MDEEKYSEEEKGSIDQNNAPNIIVSSNQYRTQSKSIIELNTLSPEAEKIKDSKWRQIGCKTTTLTYNVTWVKCLYIMIAVICIPIGVITYNLSQSVVIQEFSPYDNLPECSLGSFSSSSDWGKECTVNYTLDYDFSPPIYFHYKLTSFYQNHRDYVKSRSKNQLDASNVRDVDDCDPSNVRYSKSSDIDNKGLKMLPCGLIANSFFNDKYKVTLYNSNGIGTPLCNTSATCNGNEKSMSWSNATWYSTPNWQIDGIAWESDTNGGKYRYHEQLNDVTTDENELQQWQGVTLPDVDDEDLIVWMRTSPIDTFTKLHRIINQQSFKKGDILSVTIRNYFDVSAFHGSKSIVISTNSVLGGRNDMFGIAFMTLGAVSLLTAVCFRLLIPPKRDPSNAN